MLQSRETLNDDVIYNLFYTDSNVPKAAVGKVWHEIAKMLHVNPGKSRPNDKFSDLICLPAWMQQFLPVWTDIDDIEDWVNTLQSSVSSSNSSPINTIDELIRAVSTSTS